VSANSVPSMPESERRAADDRAAVRDRMAGWFWTAALLGAATVAGVISVFEFPGWWR
jgi:hypothetical protein